MGFGFASTVVISGYYRNAQLKMPKTRCGKKLILDDIFFIDIPPRWNHIWIMFGFNTSENEEQKLFKSEKRPFLYFILDFVQYM